ncbi:murein L,D-transpeptidase, partial [Streptomyces caniscabiei]|nr:murein L,D-transpeptidase [Streptomyces caniscabiei]
MRIKDMRRSVAAIAALAMAGACTAQGIEVHGGQRQPVRIDGSSTPDGTPKQDDGDGVDGGDRAAGGNDGDGGNEGDGKGAPGRTPTTAPPSPA